jgi:tetratricopeptide (TPR) repeat protein
MMISPLRVAAALALAGSAAFQLAPAVAQQRLAPTSQAEQRRPGPVGRITLPSLAGSYLAGRTAANGKDLDGAADFFSRALQRDPRNPELLARTFVLRLASGDVDEAAELANRVTRADGNDRLARLVLAVRAVRERRWRPAIQQLRLGDRGNIQDITGGLLAAWAAQGAGETDEAFAILDRLRGAEWYNIFRDFHAGLIADAAGRRAEAGRRLAAAHRADPNALRIVEAYARHLARTGERPRALEVINAFLERVPENPVMRALVVEVEQNRVQPHVRDVQRGAAEVLFGLGAALSRDGGDELAAIYLQLSIHLDAENGLAYVALADLFEQMRRPAKVVEAYERVPESSPMRRSAQIQLAMALDDLERTEEALAHLDRLIERNPSDIEALTTRGNILRGKKRFQEAQQAYDRALALVATPERRHWTLFYFRGISRERTQRWPEAEADFLKALELMPDQPLVLNYLGYTWVDRGEHLERAMTMLRRAVELRPNDGYIIDSVGWAYYRLGRLDEAVTWLERAVDRRPADPVINDHLGDAYWRVGRYLEATFQWRHARDLNPEPEDLVRIERKLREGLPDPGAPQAPAAEAQPEAPRQGG